MKIGGNQQINTTTPQTIGAVKTNQAEEIRIGDYLVQNSETNPNTVYGKNAEVTLNESQKASIMPGFTQQEIQIKTATGVEFRINLHVQKNADQEGVKKLTDKLNRVISNLPPKVLEDMKEEVRHITICPSIIVNKEAKALAMGELNQIFLSVEKMAELSEKEIEETITHEQGHLADRLEGTFAGKGSKYMKKSFTALKETTTPELGFEKDSYTLSNASELFADYYLYKCGNPSEGHRSKEVFDKLENYNNDVTTLTEEELQAKYGENTQAVKNVAEKWGAIKKELDFYLGNVQSGEYPRVNEKAVPHSIEQMLEINEKAKQKAIQ